MRSKRPVIGITAPSRPFKDGHGPRTCQRQAYVEAVLEAGGAPVIIPDALGADALRSVFRSLDGLLLPGGADVAPEEYGEERRPELESVNADLDRAELALARLALGGDLPVLAICRGIQVLNVAAGGSLYQDIAAQIPGAVDHRFHSGEPRDRRKHGLDIREGSLLRRIVGDGPLEVNSLHHQSVKRVAAGFVESARAPDRVIEAIERPGMRFVLGIQCHPEDLFRTEPWAAAIFRAFVAAAGAT